MIARSRGSRLLPPAGASRWPAVDAVLDLLRLLDAMRWHEAPPRHLQRELLALFMPCNVGQPGFFRKMGHLSPAMRHIARLYEAADPSDRTVMTHEIVGIVNWLDSDAVGRDRITRGRPSWRTLVERARKWDEKRLVCAQHVQSWPTPPQDFVVEGSTLVWLRCASDLFEEGRAMRHCAFDYVDDCASGQCAVASVRTKASGDRVATLMVRRLENDDWVVAQFAGKANRPVALIAHRIHAAHL